MDTDPGQTHQDMQPILLGRIKVGSESKSTPLGSAIFFRSDPVMVFSMVGSGSSYFLDGWIRIRLFS